MDKKIFLFLIPNIPSVHVLLEEASHLFSYKIYIVRLLRYRH